MRFPGHNCTIQQFLTICNVVIEPSRSHSVASLGWGRCNVCVGPTSGASFHALLITGTKKERKRCSTPQVLHFNFSVRSIFSIPAKFKHFFIRLISPLHLTSPLGQIFLLQSISALRKIIPAKSVSALRKNVFAPNVPRPGIPVSTICPNMHLPNNRSTLLRPLICRVSLS